MLNKVLLLTYWFLTLSSAEKLTSELVKCHVCKSVVEEIANEVAKVDPGRKQDIGGFRLDAKGNAISKSIPMVKSEVFLTEVMESICDKMDDYVKTTHKKTGKFMLMKIMIDGKMNPESSNVDFVQDGDMNKSLEYYCREILAEKEDEFLKNFQSATLQDNLDIKICSEDTKYCKDAPLQEDYDFDKDEL